MTTTAIVTGASRGIGRAISEELSTDHHVYGATSGRSKAEAHQANIEYFGADLAAPMLDMTAFPSVERLDVLVHSAGIAIERPLAETTREDWERSFAVNVFAVADITRHYLPALREAHGTVIFVNSGSGMMSYPNGLPYTGTKFALKTLADCLREELRDDGVQVVSLHPGFVDTDMGRGLREQQGVPYSQDIYIQPKTLADTVRLVVDSEYSAQFESIVVRPMVSR